MVSIFSSNILSVTICDPYILNLKKQNNVLKLSYQDLWGLDSSSIEEFGLWEDLQCYPNTLNSQYMKGDKGRALKINYLFSCLYFSFSHEKKLSNTHIFPTPLLHCLNKQEGHHLGTFSWRKKTAVFLDFVQITSPQFGQLVQLFLNAKNVDLSDIQNKS